MSAIDFETGEPIWIVQFYHPAGVWGNTLNASSEEEAIEKALRKFESEGLNPVRVNRVETRELRVVGDNG